MIEIKRRKTPKYKAMYDTVSKMLQERENLLMQERARSNQLTAQVKRLNIIRIVLAITCIVAGATLLIQAYILR